jgi:hypothetical protein
MKIRLTPFRLSSNAKLPFGGLLFGVALTTWLLGNASCSSQVAPNADQPDSAGSSSGSTSIDGAVTNGDAQGPTPDASNPPPSDGGPGGARTGYIGLPYSADGRGRMQATGHSEVDIVFVAAATSTLESFATEIISNANYSSHPEASYPQAAGNDCDGTTNNEDGSGKCAGAYSSGHGGTIQLDIFADDPVTHQPAGASLGAHTWKEPMNGRGFFVQAGNDQGSWQGAFKLTPAPNVTAGARYHAVFSNPHPDADRNWYGVNTMQQRGGRRRDASQGVVSALDFDVRFRGRANANGNHDTLGVWRSCSKAVAYSGGSGDDCWGSSEQITSIPVFFAVYGNGESSGNGYELNIFPYADPASSQYAAWGPPSDGTTASRQVLKVATATEVTEIGSHILPVIGSGPGVAVLNLKRLSDNSLVKTVSIPYTPPPPLPGGKLEGENGLNIVATFAPVALAAGDYYVEYQRSAGAYFPLFLQPYNVLTKTHFSETGLFQSDGLPDWPAGSRLDSGYVEFQESLGGAWVQHAPMDSMVYLKTQTASVKPTGLSPLTVTIATPTEGASVAATDNGEALVSTDATCVAGPVTFFVDGIQANVETTATWVTFPWNAPATGLKTSPALGTGAHNVYATAQDSCGRTATSATVKFSIR